MDFCASLLFRLFVGVTNVAQRRKIAFNAGNDSNLSKALPELGRFK